MLTLEQAMKSPKGNRNIALLFSETNALGGGSFVNGMP